MKKILLPVSSLLLLTSIAIADDTSTCADGAGKIVTGTVTGHQYCMSNQQMKNWWNAMAWCDGLRRRAFNVNDCACSNTTANCAGNKCAELINVYNTNFGVWTAFQPAKNTNAYSINPKDGSVHNVLRNDSYNFAFCY